MKKIETRGRKKKYPDNWVRKTFSVPVWYIEKVEEDIELILSGEADQFMKGVK